MPAFRFAQISDLHLGESGLPRQEWELRDRPTLLTHAAVDAINASGPDFTVVTGDLTYRGTEESFLFARTILDRLRMPYYVLPGNRDIRVEGDRALFCSIFAGHGPADHVYATWEMDGVRCLTLDPLWRTRKGKLRDAKPSRKKRGGLALPPDQLAWLDDSLRTHPGTPTLIFLHYPLIWRPERYRPDDPETANDLRNRDQVLSLLTSFPQVRAVFCGHLHYNEIIHVPSAGGELMHCMVCAVSDYPMMWREVTVDASIMVTTHFIPAEGLRRASTEVDVSALGTEEDRAASIPTRPTRTPMPDQDMSGQLGLRH